MSYVTNFLLTGLLDTNDLRNIAAINATLPGGGFVQVSQHAGGIKAMEQDVFAFAGNYTDPQEIVDLVKSLTWEWPETIQLFVCDQHNDTFEDWLSKA